jgi:hypothetical protein
LVGRLVLLDLDVDVVDELLVGDVQQAGMVCVVFGALVVPHCLLAPVCLSLLLAFAEVLVIQLDISEADLVIIQPLLVFLRGSKLTRLVLVFVTTITMNWNTIPSVLVTVVLAVVNLGGPLLNARYGVGTEHEVVGRRVVLRLRHVLLTALGQVKGTRLCLLVVVQLRRVHFVALVLLLSVIQRLHRLRTPQVALLVAVEVLVSGEQVVGLGHHDFVLRA